MPTPGGARRGGHRRGRTVIRHSAAHLLAQAVQHVPGRQAGHRPADQDGFYYDFQVERPFTPRTWPTSRSAWSRSSKVRASPSRAGSSPARRPSAELEVRAVQARVDRHEVRCQRGPRSMGKGRRRRADGRRQPRPAYRRRVWGDLCRGPTSDDPLDPRVPAHRSAAATGGAAQVPQLHGLRYRLGIVGGPAAYQESNAEAERRDGPRRWAWSWTFLVPDEFGSGLTVFHPAGGIVGEGLETTRGPPALRQRAISSWSPAHHQVPCSRCPGTWTGTRTACTRRCDWTPSWT